MLIENRTGKSLRSAGATVAWCADGVGVPLAYQFLLYTNKPLQRCHRYMNVFLSARGLAVCGMTPAVLMVHLCVKDHTYVVNEGFSGWC
jgi:hypothetical protein